MQEFPINYDVRTSSKMSSLSVQNTKKQAIRGALLIFNTKTCPLGKLKKIAYTCSLYDYLNYETIRNRFGQLKC